jgi:hypothetical protein
MTLEQIANGSQPIPLLQIGGDEALTKEVQTRLGDLGLLDPPADGRFGPVSQWALGQFLLKSGLEGRTSFDATVARALLESTADRLFPVNPTNTLAGHLVEAIRSRRHWLNRHPECVNIVYVEGMNESGEVNPNRPNEFNDLRIVLQINESGSPEIVDLWEATTEPGKFFTEGPERHPEGAARIAFGQYKSWSVGKHRADSPSGHEALVQVAPINIFRDANRDFRRDGDPPFSGVFGINQHWGFDLPKTDIRNASAGCLVGRTKAGHLAFMAVCKADPRFLANNGYRYMTAVLPAEAV